MDNTAQELQDRSLVNSCQKAMQQVSCAICQQAQQACRALYDFDKIKWAGIMGRLCVLHFCWSRRGGSVARYGRMSIIVSRSSFTQIVTTTAFLSFLLLNRGRLFIFCLSPFTTEHGLHSPCDTRLPSHLGCHSASGSGFLLCPILQVRLFPQSRHLCWWAQRNHHFWDFGILSGVIQWYILFNPLDWLPAG